MIVNTKLLLRQLYFNAELLQETRDLRQFSINEWYNQFSDITIKTILFEMDKELLDRLQDDGCDANVESICSPEYVNQLKNAICEFNNEAFVKNNWHAPVVCIWVYCLRDLGFKHSIALLLCVTGCKIHEFWEHVKSDNFR